MACIIVTIRPRSALYTSPSRLEILPCRINNLTMDSSAEYGMLRPSPLGPLGVEGAQQAALEEAFGAVPPPYVSEAEALLDTGIQTMEVREEGCEMHRRQLGVFLIGCYVWLF